jgi:hypothetical protein
LSVEFNIDTSVITHLGTIEHDVLAHLDLNAPEFIELAEYMFYEDFEIYNYPLTYS